MAEPAENALTAALAAGDETAFAEVYDRFGPALVRAAAMRPATVAESSGSCPPTSMAAGTRGIETHRSIRSRSGPDTRRL